MIINEEDSQMTKIAVVGVMESVGREILSFLEEDGIKAKDVFAVDYKSALGNQVSYGEDDDLDVYNLDDFDFGKVDVAIFATTDELAKRYVPKALSKGIKVIDTSSAFFAEEDVPMIVAGVNDVKVNEAKRGLVSIPSAAVTQMLLPLSKVNEKYLINRLVVTSYSSTSVYGKEGMDELFNQVRKIYMNDSLVDDQQVFNKQIAFNVIPQVGEFLGDETQTEWALNAETKKVLNGNVKVHANCAVIPAFIGCGLFVNVECADEVDVEDDRGYYEKSTFKVFSHYAELPILAAVKFRVIDDFKVVLNAGPYFAVGIGGKEEYSNTAFTNDDYSLDLFGDNRKMNRFDVGLQYGVGFEIDNHFLVNLTGQAGFITPYKHPYNMLYGDDGKSPKNLCFMLSVGYRF